MESKGKVKTIFFYHLKKNSLVGVIYFGILLILNTLPFYIAYRGEYQNITNVVKYRSEFSEIFIFEVLIFVVGSIAIGSHTFRRVFKKDYMNVLISIRTSNKQIFNAFLLVALVLYLIPLIINGGLIIVLAYWLRPSTIIEISLILLYGCLIGVTFIMSLALSATMVGNSFIQILMTFGFHLLPLLTFILLYEGMYQFVQGMSALDLYSDGLYLISPIIAYSLKLGELLYGRWTFNSIWMVNQIDVLGLIIGINLVQFFALQKTANTKQNESQSWLNQKKVKKIAIIMMSYFGGFSFGVLSVFSLLRSQTLVNFFVSSFIGLICGFILAYYMSYRSFKFYDRVNLLVIIVISFYIFIMSVGIYGSNKYSHIPDFDDVETIAISIQNNRITESDGKRYTKSTGYYDMDYQAEFLREDYEYNHNYLNAYESYEAKLIIWNYLNTINSITKRVPQNGLDRTIVVNFETVEYDDIKLYKILDDIQGEQLDDMLKVLQQTDEYIAKHHGILMFNSKYLKSIECTFVEADGQEQSYFLDNTQMINDVVELIEEIVIDLKSTDTEDKKLMCILTYERNGADMVVYETINHGINDVLSLLYQYDTD